MHCPFSAISSTIQNFAAVPETTTMRQQRAKRYRKAMALYQTSFQFREPYQILLSADFILAAHRFKLNLASLLQRTIQAPLKLSESPQENTNTQLTPVLSGQN
jgi:hypothetical protein